MYQDYYESAGGTGGNNSRAMAPSPNTAQRQLPATPIADNHRSSDPYSLLDGKKCLCFCVCVCVGGYGVGGGGGEVHVKWG